MNDPDYLGIPAPQVRQRIATCAWHLRLPRGHLADAQQEILHALGRVTFDPQHPSGAAPLTFLTTIINRQLRSYLRKLRQSQRSDRALDETLAEYEQPHAPPHAPPGAPGLYCAARAHRNENRSGIGHRGVAAA